MSSFRAINLDVETNQGAKESPSLWSRGGFSGVCVRHGDKEYDIPESVLWMLFAEEYKRRHISQFEQMDADDVRAKLGIGEKR